VRTRLVPALLGALFALSACTRSAGEAPARKVALAPCRLEGVGRQALCGTWEVWEDRQARQGRKVPLRVVVIPALASSPEEEPLVLLAGGPGQAASTLAAQVLPMVERIHRHRDLVLVDQRGTGASRPLDCEVVPPEAPLAAHFDDTFPEQRLRECLAGHDADPRLYTTPIAMDDLDEVREALGYRRLNLWGLSYGTRAALVYLRRHPGRVRTLVLDGVAPLSLKLPVSTVSGGQRALELLFAHCEQDATCAARYPELRSRFMELLARLRSEPVRTRVEHPLTGVPEDVSISARAFISQMHGLLYLPEVMSLVPLVVDRASRGDWRPFVALGYGVGGGQARGLSYGMFFSVVCAEDVPFTTEEEIERETRDTWVGDRPVRDTLRVCDFWPRGEVPEGYHEPVVADVPVLLLSGELDPVTPPRWAEEARRTLKNSLHVALPGVGHGTGSIGCVRALMADFVARGRVEGLEPRCGEHLQRPPFFTSFAGPVP
jgi:pimeloyl-ACP methyl ester carboxylesterase